MVGFQKTDFGISSAEGAGNTKIGFITRIADFFLAILIIKIVFCKQTLGLLAKNDFGAGNTKIWFHN